MGYRLRIIAQCGYVAQLAGSACTLYNQAPPIFMLFTDIPDSQIEGVSSLRAPNMDVVVIDSLTLEQYHEICHWSLCRYRRLSISTPITVKLGAVVRCFSREKLEYGGVSSPLGDRRGGGIRDRERLDAVLSLNYSVSATEAIYLSSFRSRDVFHSIIRLLRRGWRTEPRLSLANHIFSRLKISSSFEDYGKPNLILPPFG